MIQPGGTDSATFDNVIELLYLSGRSMAHAMAMLIPEAWAGNPTMTPRRRPSTNITPRSWNPGTAPPPSPSPTGASIGATLDRNGLRPARYLVTDDDLLIMSSETGVLPVKPEDVSL